MPVMRCIAPLVSLCLLLCGIQGTRAAHGAVTPCGHVGALLGFVALDAKTIAGSTDAGNMVRSVDGGHCWQAARLDTPLLHRLGDVLRDPSVPSILLAGAGSPARVGIGAVDGLLRSADGGRSWQTLGPRAGLPAGRFTVSALAATPRALYAALVCTDELAAIPRGRPYRYQCGRPIYRSLDDGRTWRPTTLGSATVRHGPPPFDGSVVALATAGDTLYAVAVPLSGANGVYRSLDGGATWQLTAQQDALRGSTALLALPGPRAVLLAGTGLTSLSGAIMRSDDGGRSWDTALSAAVMQDPLVLDFVARHGHTIYCAGLAHLFASRDDGQSWAPLPAAGLPGQGYTYLQMAPGGALLLATMSGLFSSTDGTHWQLA